MREYEIKDAREWSDFVFRLQDYFCQRDARGLPFLPLRVVVKKLKKYKSRPQHRAYWMLVGKLKKALKEKGYIYNEAQIHEFVKRESGFTEVQEMPDGSHLMVTKSIADSSDDATSKHLNELIEFILAFAAEKLDVALEVGSDVE